MGKSICSYTSLGNNTPRDIDKKFREIHKYLCYYQTSIPSQNGNSGKFLTTDGISLSWGNISSGSGLFPVTGTGTATGDVTGDLDGNSLSVREGGNNFLFIDPTVNDESAALAVYNTTGFGNYARIQNLANDVRTQFTIDGNFNDGTKVSSIVGFADATTSTITYTADSHQFAGNVGIGATPSADQVFLINTGIYDAVKIDKTNFDSRFGMGDDTGVSYIEFYTVASGSIYGFQLYSDNGDNHVEMDGDAGANTVTITAGAGVSLSAPASTTAAILANGTISFYLDEVGNNLKVAVQYSDGTTKTGTVLLA